MQTAGEAMFNILLDELPYKWNGYSINVDFQIGIQISQVLADKEFAENERLAIAAELLYCDFPESLEEAVEGIIWFLNSWNHDNHKAVKSKSTVAVMDFDIDQWRIYAAFKAQYGIDLNTERLHWFVFMGMLSNLEECSYTRVIDLRQKLISSKMSVQEKNALKELKKVYAINENEEKKDELELEATQEFLKLIGK